MKQKIHEIVSDALEELRADASIHLPEKINIQIDRTHDTRHGDFATNVALILAKSAKKSPRELARKIVEHIPTSHIIKNVEIAEPGFINVFLNESSWHEHVMTINRLGNNYGKSDPGKGISVLIEYVSTNPTGPLHVGHGRGAAYGASVANLLEAAGYTVTREYYVNDAGRQMDILCISVWLRYLIKHGEAVNFPENAYQGDYIFSIAEQLSDKHNDRFLISINDETQKKWSKLTDEERLDEIISFTSEQLGIEDFTLILQFALDNILSDIQMDLGEFGIEFDNWFSERSLFDSDQINHCIAQLESKGDIYEQDDAKWFKSSKYGDEKDRVVVRDNGQQTYFASDIAYHINKYNRKFDKLINVWGADHHGYIPRVKASLQACGKDPDQLEILLVQFAVLYRGKEKVSMSTRSGDYVRLRDLRDEIGNDAARFFYVTRKSEQHLDFDLELAKSHTRDNPVYSIQYTHARISSVIKKTGETGHSYEAVKESSQLDVLNQELEIKLIKSLAQYPEILESAADKYEPHQICYYLRDVANNFHAYYDKHKIIVEDDALRNARLALILATRQVIKNGLRIIGVSAPDVM